MKALLYPFLVVLTIAGLSCHKSAGLSIVGKWRIISDSTNFTGNASNASASYHSTYVGTASDYYDFRTDGKMYVKEGAMLDTMTYEVYSGNQVRCTPSPGFTTNYNTTSLTATTATFNISGYTLAGQLLKIIELER